MSLPAIATPVTLRIPDREAVSGHVTHAGKGWLDVELNGSLLTPTGFLEQHSVFLEYVEPAGLVRIMGHVEPSPMAPYATPPVLRFNHRDVVQLLRRREFAGGIVHASITLVGVRPDSVAHATNTVAIGATEIAIHDLPGAVEGEQYYFRIAPGGNEPPVNGTATVVRVAHAGHVVLRFDHIAEFERERLGRLLVRRSA
jgi:hypothetical protein